MLFRYFVKSVGFLYVEVSLPKHYDFCHPIEVGLAHVYHQRWFIDFCVLCASSFRKKGKTKTFFADLSFFVAMSLSLRTSLAVTLLLPKICQDCNIQ